MPAKEEPEFGQKPVVLDPLSQLAPHLVGVMIPERYQRTHQHTRNRIACSSASGAAAMAGHPQSHHQTMAAPLTQDFGFDYRMQSPVLPLPTHLTDARSTISRFIPRQAHVFFIVSVLSFF
jgi:hypothetical protein